MKQYRYFLYFFALYSVSWVSSLQAQTILDQNKGPQDIEIRTKTLAAQTSFPLNEDDQAEAENAVKVGSAGEAVPASCQSPSKPRVVSESSLDSTVIGYPQAFMVSVSEESAFGSELVVSQSEMRGAPFATSLNVTGNVDSENRTLAILKGSGPSFGGSDSPTGVGDPAPGGGTFAAFRAPNLSAVGNIAFLAQKFLGDKKITGLYLFQSHSQAVVKIIEEGDLLNGSVVTAVGPASLTDESIPTLSFFVATELDHEGWPIPQVVLWKDGKNSILMKKGDALPDSKIVDFFAHSAAKMRDEKQIFTTMPLINNALDIALAVQPTVGNGAFYALRTDESRIVSMVVRRGMRTVEGFILLELYSLPVPQKETDFMVFMALYRDKTSVHEAWFLRKPNGAIRRVIGFGDTINYDTHLGSPISLPVQLLAVPGYVDPHAVPVDRCGNVYVSVGLSENDFSNRAVVRSDLEGTLHVIAARDMEIMDTGKSFDLMPGGIIGVNAAQGSAFIASDTTGQEYFFLTSSK